MEKICGVVNNNYHNNFTLNMNLIGHILVVSKTCSVMPLTPNWAKTRVNILIKKGLVTIHTFTSYSSIFRVVTVVLTNRVGVTL